MPSRTSARARLGAHLARTRIAFAGALLMLGSSACWFGDESATAPPGGFAPAAFSFSATLVAQRANAINVRIVYRRGGSRADVLLIDSTASFRRSSTGSLGWQGTRGFPFEIDLTRCLVDPDHLPSGPSCFLRVFIQLLDNGQPAGGLDFPIEITAVPGRTTILDQEVSLSEIGAVTAIAPGEPQLAVGASAALQARVFDVMGTLLPTWPVAWQSTDPAVARVDERGVVTGVATGLVTLRATAGRHSGAVTLAVTAGESTTR